MISRSPSRPVAVPSSLPTHPHRLPAPGELGEREQAQVLEDLEQACAVATVTLAYNPETDWVLRGPYRGMDVDDALNMETRHLLETFSCVVASFRTVRPWWRLWRPTPAIIVRPRSWAVGVPV